MAEADQATRDKHRPVGTPPPLRSKSTLFMPTCTNTRNGALFWSQSVTVETVLDWR
jgi:hypothetical protein